MAKTHRSEILRGASREELEVAIHVLCRKRLIPLVEVERLVLDVRLDSATLTMESSVRRMKALEGEAWKRMQARWERARDRHERALALRFPDQLRSALAGERGPGAAPAAEVKA